MIEIKTQHAIHSVLFSEDCKQVLSGGKEGVLRRWRVEDGQEVGEPIQIERAEIFAAALSPDRSRLVCGLRTPNSTKETARVRVWDAQTNEKVRDIRGHTGTVFSVDVSPDSTKLATGGLSDGVFIWSMTTGKRLIGPLKHDGTVVAVRFSPNGDRIATATGHDKDTKSIRIYDSDNGKQLLVIPCRFWHGISSPLAWSADGRQLCAASYSEVKCFNTSSGTLLNKWSAPGGGSSASIALAHNQKFMVIRAYKSLSFWDTSTHRQIGIVIETTSPVWSISLSPNDDCIMTGEEDGKSPSGTFVTSYRART
ncbi:WD40-repeat-containing domain protein [Boletus reticuloceps]|uniref:WD40-repeat-containing domain protein n=1 Tax=Boletus reticuloceps TaxID=495285 RepID=A0A8I2YSF4_9AGAM|nr:WD40-repeat-containing domain protein [Boletus reticuloceps]